MFNRMESFYIILGLIGLAGTAVQLPAYLGMGPLAGTLEFWKQSVTTPAGIFLVVDIFVLAAAVLVWMFGECRRLGITARWAWTYFLGSLFVGISFAFPLFMAHRHRRLRQQHPEQCVAPAGADGIGIAIVLLAVGVAVGYSFAHLPT